MFKKLKSKMNNNYGHNNSFDRILERKTAKSMMTIRFDDYFTVFLPEKSEMIF